MGDLEIKKKILPIIIISMLSIGLVGCGKNASAWSDIQSQNEAVTESNDSSSTASDTELVTEDKVEVSTGPSVEVVNSGIIDHLIEVANDPNATTNQDSGVSYMFVNGDDGSRTLGSVMAYYKGLDNLDTTNAAAYCRSYIENYATELLPYYDSAEFHDDDGHYGVVITTDKCIVTLLPGNNCEGLTVFISPLE